ncbi:X protein [Capuchin monkey hepatitis B virus]|uniref:Protein X n=1 Tax=Capuchin monkey hepatitis B virus TaxID=2163996 RepID=A0A2R4KZU8_9HEPA|nr:X protein [Capuchin monkey hepatitis B virus]AVV68830.1 X protein [Capuchin monkey hepatitis B virus]
MAARLCCQLDPARDVLCLRPVTAEPCGRPFSGSARTSAPAAAAALPSIDGAYLSLRGLPSCAFSSSGPCALRFTSARRMATPMNSRDLVQQLYNRTLGLAPLSTGQWERHFKDLLFEEWEELGVEFRLKVFVLGGCRHKLVCSVQPCIFFTSA